ncbi:MAG: ATP12 family chaperone protein [Rhodomicrobiaceae bacterium]
MKNDRNAGGEPLKRFYSQVTLDDAPEGWRILLDGRTVRTPQLAPLTLPSRPLAEAIAEEWRRQGDTIDLGSMPLTKFANTALDAVAPNALSVAEDVLNFARRDLVCYRAEKPETLAARQTLYWNPLLDWADEHYGARLVVTEGVMPVDQPENSIAALRTPCACLDPFGLTALHVMTSLTGSAILALAHIAGRLSLEESWAAAHVDEDFQIEHWGEDAEAMARREQRFEEMRAASEFFQLSREHPAEPV